jgi:hypothetical protein
VSKQCAVCNHWHIGDVGPCGVVLSLGSDRMGRDDRMCGCWSKEAVKPRKKKAAVHDTGKDA